MLGQKKRWVRIFQVVTVRVGGTRKGGAPKGGAPKCGPRWVGPKISRFSVVLFVPLMCTFGLWGCRVKPGGPCFFGPAYRQVVLHCHVAGAKERLAAQPMQNFAAAPSKRTSKKVPTPLNFNTENTGKLAKCRRRHRQHPTPNVGGQMSAAEPKLLTSN